MRGRTGLHRCAQSLSVCQPQRAMIHREMTIKCQSTKICSSSSSACRMERYDRPVHCSQLSHTLRFVQYKNIVNVRVQAVHISMSFRTNDRRVEKGANHAAQILPALNIIVHDSRHHADDQEAQECCYVHDGVREHCSVIDPRLSRHCLAVSRGKQLVVKRTVD